MNVGCVVWSVFSGSSFWICSCGSMYCGIVSLVLGAMVMEWSFKAFAISFGSVCVLFSYISVVGDVLVLLLSDMIVSSIFACCLGSFFVYSICFVMWSRFAFCIAFFTLFMYVLCFWMFSYVGFVMLRLCSLCCCFIIRFVLVSHHAFRLGLGIFSCSSITVWIAFCM